jgi:hypothetical protein
MNSSMDEDSIDECRVPVAWHGPSVSTDNKTSRCVFWPLPKSSNWLILQCKEFNIVGYKGEVEGCS